MKEPPSDIVKVLVEKGVKIPLPHTVYIAPDVNPEMISGQGVVIYPGTRISGSTTVIMEGCVLGADGPVTIRNCQLGKGVTLASGSFEKSCFLDRAQMGPGAQVRECCLLEEGAKGAHTVGLKHTILFPFVTLGSLVNFCDCLMAGGTDEKNHSEVGSSYIHFNYTPNQDKATASLIGDVPRGVMLNQPPIFLGGQGGLVGPVRINYGVVVAAGTIVRKDLLEENTMLLGYPSLAKKVPHRLGLYQNIKRIIELNSLYIANLIALRWWYQYVRKGFFSNTFMGESLWRGAVDKLERAIGERIKRLGKVAEAMEESIKIQSSISSGKIAQVSIERKREFQKNWPAIVRTFEEHLASSGLEEDRNIFLDAMERVVKDFGSDYLKAVKGLRDDEARKGTQWLQGIVEDIMQKIWLALPSFQVRRRS